MHKFGRLIEISVLTLLRNGDKHGYKLLNDMISNKLIEDNINIGIVYRSLRGLEKKGFISSYWEESSHGPKKRIYKIEDEGIKEIKEMIKLLKDRRNKIDTVIKLNSDLEE